MNVLVVGYGSIARRHVLNLAGFECIDKIGVYSTLSGDLDESYKNKVSFLNSSYAALGDACKQLKFDFAIIANETHKHIETAIVLAAQEIHLFIEKPISHNLDKIDILQEIAEDRKIKVFLAYNLRFLPAIQFIKDQISLKALGDLYFAKIEVGHYLPSWRTTIDYRRSYSAAAESGGGVSLDLSHEVDYMRYLFGEPAVWKTLKSKSSGLEIDSDDVFEGIYKYHQGFICNVHMDYLQRTPKRTIRVAGDKGYMLCDLVEKRIEVFSNGNEVRLIDEDLFKIENTYNQELRHFIDCIKFNKEPGISVDDGIRALRLLEDGHDR